MMRDNRQAVWCTKDTDGKHTYIAVFNLQDQAGDVSLPWDAIERYGITANIAKELWSGDQQDLRNCEAVSDHCSWRQIIPFIRTTRNPAFCI